MVVSGHLVERLLVVALQGLRGLRVDACQQARAQPHTGAERRARRQRRQRSRSGAAAEQEAAEAAASGGCARGAAGVRTVELLLVVLRRSARMELDALGHLHRQLLQLLEGRLDNVVYRLGFGATRSEARQLVSHRAILVNGRSVNIASYQVSPGDIVTVREKAKNQLRVKNAMELAQQRGFPTWVEVDEKKFEGTFKALPERIDLPAEINENLIVELYSK